MVKMPQSTESTSSAGASETALIEKLVAIVESRLDDKVSQSVNTRITNMANSVAIISKSVNDRVAAIEAENKQHVEQLTVRLKVLEKQTDKRVDAAVQYLRRYCLRISGVPEKSEESTDEMVLDVAKKCDVHLSLVDIDRSNRVRPRKPPEKP